MTSQWIATRHPSFYGVNFNPTEHPDELATVDGHTLKNGTLLTQYLNVDDATLAARLWVTAANSGAPLETPGYQELVPTNAINVVSLGADPMGVTESGAIINRAIAEASARRYARVYIPSGKYLIEETIVLPSLIWLHGDGFGTVLFAKANLNAPVIEAYWEAGVSWGIMQRISDLRIDGNRDNQSSPANCYGLKLQAPDSAGLPNTIAEPVTLNPTAGYSDSNRDLFNLWISFCASDGINMSGRGGLHAQNVTCYENQGHGFVPTYDTSWVNCVAARNGQAGFVIATSTIRMTACKAWWSGYRRPASYLDYATHGFFFTGGTRGAVCVGCEAQDNYSSGFAFNDVIGHACYDCIADSNNRRQGDNVGVDFYNAYGNTWTGMVYDRYNDSIRYQPNALRLRSSSTMNRIVLSHRHYNGGATAAGQQLLQHIATDTDSIQGNDITINNMLGMQKISAGTSTPSVYHGGHVLCNLNQNSTINYDPTGTIIPPGARLRFMFVQDGTGGRTVTFSSAYRYSWTPNTTASKINTIDFAWNNESSKWVQVGSETGI